MIRRRADGVKIQGYKGKMAFVQVQSSRFSVFKIEDTLKREL